MPPQAQPSRRREAEGGWRSSARASRQSHAQARWRHGESEQRLDVPGAAAAFAVEGLVERREKGLHLDRRERTAGAWAWAGAEGNVDFTRPDERKVQGPRSRPLAKSA